MFTLQNSDQSAVFHLMWIVLLLPVFGFLFQAVFGKRIENILGKEKGRKVLGTMAVLPIALGFLIGVVVFFELSALPKDGRLAITTWFDWIDLQSLRIPFELRIDPLSMTMVLIVTGVGALIHLYATGYMETDRDYPRFFTYLNLFIFFMLILVLGNNLGLLFIGWEGVGLCSYLLIGFWYEDIENAKAANKAFIVNRIGDWGMALGMFLIAVVFASNQQILGVGETRYLSFDVILPKAVEVLGGYGALVVTGIPLLLFIGAMGKSAQFPLYLWLPDAMAGPTPVSALIHAATMVTAGVYLVTRCFVFFELSPGAMMFVAGIGAFTAIFAATIAFGQTDIKKILAYSTVSQLGFMFLGCGVGAFYTGMFHVTTHAFFKALLFLGAGAVIVAMAHNQDIRNYGNLRKYLPITFFTMFIAWFAISGIIPFAGFFSKDDILAKTFASGSYWSMHGGFDTRILYAIALFTALLTAAYMTRMFVLTFLSKEERWRNIQQEEHHADAHSHVHSHDVHEHHEDPHGFYLSHEEQTQTHHEEHEHHHELTPDFTPKEVKPSMWIPLAVLAVLSLIGGAVLSGMYPIPELFGFHVPNFFKEWLYPSTSPSVLPTKEMFHVSHSVEIVLILASLSAAVIGIGVMLWKYGKGLPETEKEMRGWRYLAGQQWLYDSTMYRLFVHWGGRFANGFYKWFDAGIIDGVFVNGTGWFVSTTGKILRRMQSGFVRSYAMMMLVGTVILVAVIWYFTQKPQGTP